MPGTALRAYLETIDPAAERLVIALDRAVRSASPRLDSAIRYRILMYTIDGDWGTWVCAVDASRKRVSLRFLYGVLLDDPKNVLRKGSSVLMSWDFGLDDAVPAKVVKAYVAEAVEKHAEYKANHEQVREAARGKPATRP